MDISKDTVIKALLETYPKAISFFMRNGFACIGCSMQTHHTLQDVSINYKIDLEKLIKDLTRELKK